GNYKTDYENLVVQTLEMDLPTGLAAGLPDYGGLAVVLRAGVLGSGPKIAFGQRHALRGVPIFCLQFPAVGLDRLKDKSWTGIIENSGAGQLSRFTPSRWRGWKQRRFIICEH